MAPKDWVSRSRVQRANRALTDQELALALRETRRIRRAERFLPMVVLCLPKAYLLRKKLAQHQIPSELRWGYMAKSLRQKKARSAPPAGRKKTDRLAQAIHLRHAHIWVTVTDQRGQNIGLVGDRSKSPYHEIACLD